MKSRNLFSLYLLSLSPMALAQSFSPSIAVLNTIYQPPGNIQGTICANQVNSGVEHEYMACSDGVAAARWTAETYAQNAGKFLGCVDGIHQGLWDGYISSKNPTPEITAEVQDLLKNSRFESAEKRAIEKARTEGSTESTDQIIRRYRNAVGSKVAPDKSYQYPPITFKGFDDGYETDFTNLPSSHRISFNDAYNQGWVKSSDDFETRLAARRALQLQAQYAKDLCNPNQTILGRTELPTPSLWDYFRARRQYQFQAYGWQNADWAWDIFNSKQTIEQFATFNKLNTLEKNVTVPVKESRLKLDAAGNPIKKLDAAGNPVLDAQGKPVFEKEEVIVSYRTERVKLSSAEVQNLKDLYTNGFKNAYRMHYAAQYASIHYNKEAMDKYRLGSLMGQMIGQDVARQTAKRDAYNAQYKLQSSTKFAAEVKSNYERSFNQLLGIFENNPVLELNDAQIVGQTADGIFRAGELLAVNFTATNLGEKPLSSGSLVMDNSVDVNAPNSTFQFSVPSLSQQSFSTPAMGQVSNDKFARQSVMVGLAVQNAGNVTAIASNLEVRKNTSIKLNDYAEIDRVDGSFNYLLGELSLDVTVLNPATITSPSTSTVELAINGSSEVITRELMPINAQSRVKVAIAKTGLDPLDLILKGPLTGRVSVKMAGRTIHSEALMHKVVDSKNLALMKYFDALATKESTNAGSDSRQQRLASLITLLEYVVKESVDERIKWTEASEVQSSPIGTLQKLHAESKRQGTLNSDAQAYYQLLGEALAPMVKDLESRGILNDRKNKKAYLSEIAKFAPKINTNPKKY